MARTTASAPRAAAPSLPFRLPCPPFRLTCRPVIGDSLLLRYALTAWAADHATVTRRRDEVVRAAVDAGVSKNEIHRLTGIARTTIDRIAGSGRTPAQEGATR